MTTMLTLKKASDAKAEAAMLTTVQKNNALYAIAEGLLNEMPAILEANERDLKAAEGIISPVMLDRLRLTPERVNAMAQGVKEVAALPDPVGNCIEGFTRCDGLCIKKVSVPLGVVAIIYESRPNVTSDAAALCLKSGNACVLRAGKEAHASALAIVDAMRRALVSFGLNENLINLIDDTSRHSAEALMTAVGYVDLLIPRGGAGLINACVQNAKVPCIQTGTGICHVYVDKSARFDMAEKIIVNAKCSRPSVCNAMEVCLVHADIAAAFLPVLYNALVKNRPEHPVLLKLDEQAYSILGGRFNCVEAVKEDFDTEFLDYIMAVKVVSDVSDAIKHISEHSTGHSDCIITEDHNSSDLFVRMVDSAAVYVNASTRFTDGGEFGLGCEMGISTQKLHARGPMGLKELTTYKYVVRGVGNIR